MASESVIQLRPGQWTQRSRMYVTALLLALYYLMLGRLSHEGVAWQQVYLPLSAAGVLLVAGIAIETNLYVLRLRSRQQELVAGRAREQELAAQLAFHRQNILNRISRALIDKLDCNQISADVLEMVAQLFDADLAAVWVIDKTAAGDFMLKGASGLQAHSNDQLDKIPWGFPWYEVPGHATRQHFATNIQLDLPPALARLCEREHVCSATFSPVVRRNALVGVVGIFFRNSERAVNEPLAAEMQTVANIFASAIQAEELYRDLVQVQKIESIGTLTSGIAHDFNNVLAAILACASYCKQHTVPSSPAYRYLEATEASAHRGAALTKQLLSFARREGPRLTVFDVNDRVEQTLKMIERSFEKNVLIQRQFAKDLHPIEADPSQLEQVVLNIAVNARDAMLEGGIFTISTRNARLDSKNPYRPAVKVPDGDYIVIGFRDTGHGMDAVTQKRILEPFFTTKRPGKGTGLGLSVVNGIVKSFNGEMRVESAPGKGALFEVFVPATSKPLPKAPVTGEAKARGGSECILLAEDEEVIREMAQLGLEAQGYKVIAAEDGASAMARYREEWQGVDLVIADMNMPHMSGPELIAAMREINPHVRVVVSSGYSHDQEGQRMLQHGCLGYLQKPYNNDSLAKLVRSVLDSGL